MKVKVRYKNGREAELKGFIAMKMAEKGKVEILEKDEPAGEKSIEDMKKSELKAKADEIGLEVPASASKQEYIDAIKGAYGEAG